MTAPVTLAIIAAIAENGFIGRNNTLPWRLSDDLRRFRSLTIGHAVVMGRRTYESMGRPLPERRNLVLSRAASFAPPGVEVCSSLRAAEEILEPGTQLFVLGGHSVFAEALTTAARLFLTRVHADVEGDVLFPPVNFDEWELTTSSSRPADERNEHPFTFEDYVRRPA